MAANGSVVAVTCAIVDPAGAIVDPAGAIVDPEGAIVDMTTFGADVTPPGAMVVMVALAGIVVPEGAIVVMATPEVEPGAMVTGADVVAAQAPVWANCIPGLALRNSQTAWVKWQWSG